MGLNLRILLVEDEPNVAGMLAKGLRERTYRLTSRLTERRLRCRRISDMPFPPRNLRALCGYLISKSAELNDLAEVFCAGGELNGGLVQFDSFVYCISHGLLIKFSFAKDEDET